MSSDSAKIADVLTIAALDTAYSYAVPAGMSLALGDVVHVPLGPRETTGVVWELKDASTSSLSKIGRAHV